MYAIIEGFKSNCSVVLLILRVNSLVTLILRITFALNTHLFKKENDVISALQSYVMLNVLIRFFQTSTTQIPFISSINAITCYCIYVCMYVYITIIIFTFYGMEYFKYL